jgi:transcription antitermination protein NusB
VQALGALYAADVLNADDVETSHLSQRASALATGTWAHRAQLDEAIAETSTGWRVERMPAVDRTILRLGAYELRFTDQPKAVVISQAVELAKAYSTARSGRFVNGVLSSLADEFSRRASEDSDL